MTECAIAGWQIIYMDRPRDNIVTADILLAESLGFRVVKSMIWASKSEFRRIHDDDTTTFTPYKYKINRAQTVKQDIRKSLVSQNGFVKSNQDYIDLTGKIDSAWMRYTKDSAMFIDKDL